MSSPSSPTSGNRSSTWQDRLQDHCARLHLPNPVFSIVSDRRGGRTAWSSTVTVSGHHVIQARYWYDGQYVNNAKEDAAEVALQQMMMGGAAAAAGRGGSFGSQGQGLQGQAWRGGLGVGL